MVTFMDINLLGSQLSAPGQPWPIAQDEVFHGPQSRHYCHGAFEVWHPKITTFPGIYYLATVYGWCRWAVQAALLKQPLDMVGATGVTGVRSGVCARAG